MADELSDRGARVTFLGTAEREEARMVPAAGYRLLTYRVRGFERRPSPALARSLLLAGAAPAACARILRRERPDVVFGAGGYVAGPALAAAAGLRLPSALLEVDSHIGLANRLAVPLVRRVFLSFPIAGKGPPRFRLVGRPVPRSVLRASREAGRTRFELPAEAKVVLVFGGSIGARSLNRAAVDAWAGADPGFVVVHVTGRRDHAEVAPHASTHLRVIEFTPHLGDLLAASDLVVSRAGGSVFEIAAAGRPSVLVPYPSATADHQAKNARHVADAGAAVVLPDAELSAARLRVLVAALLAEPARLEAMAAAARGLSRPHAAADIAGELLEMAA